MTLPSSDPRIASTPETHATTTGMTGGGFYNANSAPQWQAIEAVLDWVDEAMSTVPLSASGTVALADFGCSEGRNSIAVMARAATALMSRSQNPIHTIHSDLPSNDFSSLLKKLRPDGHSVFGVDRVFSSVVGGSMFDQLMPPGSLHFACTFNAIGFLSEKPVKSLPGYILPNGPSRERANGVVSDEDREAFAKLAKRDVDRFLINRAKELVPGGKVLLQVFGGNDEARTCDGIYDLLNDAVLSFVKTGEISEETYENYYQPVYMRSLEELLAPMKEPGFKASQVYDLEAAKAYEVPVPFVEQFRKNGDLEAYSTAYVDFFRAFTEAVLRAALLPAPGRDDLVEGIYAKARALLKAAPERYPFRYVAVAMLLTRKG